MFKQMTDIFAAAAIKILSAVDANANSHQHEIGGLVKCGFGRVLGDDPTLVRRLPTHYVWMEDDEDNYFNEEGSATWYNTRRFSPSGRSPEFRLYYDENAVSERYQQGTQLLLAYAKVGKLLMVATPPQTRAAQQVQTLFAFNTDGQAEGEIRAVSLSNQKLDLPLFSILSREYGLTLVDDGERREALIEKAFPNATRFPSTLEFSQFVQHQTESSIDVLEKPDEALVTLQQEEELFFLVLELMLVREDFKREFAPEKSLDFEKMTQSQLHSVLELAKSALNRRKSRAGSAFENHIAYILSAQGITFTAQGCIDGKHRPDFIFPGVDLYCDPDFPASFLRLLAAKTTVKERWRQVLKEGDRIPVKHLITLERSISESSIEEMNSSDIRLIVPEPYRQTYPEAQQRKIMPFADFLEEVLELQKKSVYFKH